MSLSSLSSAQIRRLILLVKEKETIQAKLAALDQSLNALQNGTQTNRRSVPHKRGRRRTKLKDAILAKLSAAGKSGLTVKELATSLNAKPTSVSVWFYTTGKKTKAIKKVGIGRFAYIE